MATKNGRLSNGKRKWFTKPGVSLGNETTFGASGDSILVNKEGYIRSDGSGLVAIVDGSGERYEPGFTPNSVYLVGNTSSAPNGWYGNLLDLHIESLTVEERFNQTVEGVPIEGNPYSKRDTLLAFNDTSTDYFLHDLQIAGRTPFEGQTSPENAKNTNTVRSQSFKQTGYENQDPVIYGFQIIIDAISSPLLNGSINDFISAYPYVDELNVRNMVYLDFKKQFIKLFKTKGTVDVRKGEELFLWWNGMSDNHTNPYYEDLLNAYANSETTSNFGKRGKTAYLSHYLQKIDGLSKLVESNTSLENKFLVDYGKDLIKLSFNEDVSGTLSVLAHLYKLLYWSKPNGKGMIPENLLRFNCDIIVSECRNFNRVRKELENGRQSIKVLKDNVSRHVYSLRECQFYFDKVPHDDSVDMGNIQPYGLFEVNFDYKYSTSRYEKWAPDPDKFGQYISYNSGAIWKIGNRNAREVRKNPTSADNKDYSTPKFYLAGSNSFREKGVGSAIVLEDYKIVPDKVVEFEKPPFIGPSEQSNLFIPTAVVEDSEEGASSSYKTVNIEKKEKTMFDKLKDKSKKAAQKGAKAAKNFAINEVNKQINLRAKLLSKAVNDIKEALGFNGLETEPRNVYTPVELTTGGIFYDVRNQLYNFLGQGPSNSLGLSSLSGFGDYPSVIKKNAGKIKQVLSQFGK